MKAKTAVKKPNIFVRMGRKIKEVFSELKKVTWPTFGKVMKATGAVIRVVVLFLIVFTAVNYGLSELLQLITGLAIRKERLWKILSRARQNGTSCIPIRGMK